MRIEKEYIKFINYTSGSSDYPEAKIEITFGNDATLSEILEKFENFLRASGYVFKGSLDILEDDSEQTNNTYKGEF
jgi:hypothetical protein